MRGQLGFWDLSNRLELLTKGGDPLVRLKEVVHFEAFRYRIDKALNRSDGAKGGRPPFDAVLMFKILVLQALYNLSDDQAEFMIRDRLSFMRFLDLGLSDRVPDAKTIWLFREMLTEAKAIDKLFRVFDDRLKESGYLAMSGQIIDATLVEAPRQRNDDDEKQAIGEGRIPEDWQDNPHKLAQKDMDARWTVKRGKIKKLPDGTALPSIMVPAFGYKNHIGIDKKHGFIRRFEVSDASVHDSRRFEPLLDTDNTAADVWADTAYRSAKNEKAMVKRGLTSKVHFRRAPGKKLPTIRARANAARSKVRSAVEHVFATQKGPMNIFVRTIGLARATTKIGMANLVYNMRRLVWWDARTAPA